MNSPQNASSTPEFNRCHACCDICDARCDAEAQTFGWTEACQAGAGPGSTVLASIKKTSEAT